DRPAPLPLRVVRTLLYQSERLLGSRENLAARDNLAQADVFHSPLFPLPRQPRRARGPQRFLTVYDLTPILFPHFFAFEEDRFIRSALASVGPEDWVLCISESCRQDLCGFLEIDPSRVFVTHLAADPSLFYPCKNPGRAQAVRAKY